MLQIGIMLNRSIREGVAERLREALQRHDVARKATIDAAVVLHGARLQWGGRVTHDVHLLLTHIQGAPSELEGAAVRLLAGFELFQSRAAAQQDSVLVAAGEGLGTPTPTMSTVLMTTFLGDAIGSGPLAPTGGTSVQAARAWLEREARSAGSARSGVLPTLAAVGGFRGRQRFFERGGRKLVGQLEEVTERLVSDVESDLDGLRRALNEQRRLTELVRSHGSTAVQEARRLRGSAPADCALFTPEQHLGLRRLVRSLHALHGALTRQLECG